jgi:hypothetical protein
MAAPVYDASVGTAFSTTAVQTLTVTVGAGGVAAGDVVFITAAWNDSSRTIASVTDSKSNTYRVDVNAGPRAGTSDWVGVACGYMTTALVNTDTIVVHWSASGVGPGLCCRMDSFSGFSSLPSIDGIATNSQSASTAPTTGTATTTNANDLLIVCFGSSNAGTDVISGDASYTDMGGSNTGLAHGAAHDALWSQYRIVSSAGTYSATGADAAASNWFSTIVGYKQSDPLSSISLPTPFGSREPRFFSPGVRTRAEGTLAELNAQQGHPNLDTITSTWTRGGVDNGSLYAQVDEAAPGDDADYITSTSS